MKKCVFILVAFLTAACSSHHNETGGVCLTFDDRSIDAWYEMMPMLDSSSVKVTFFVTQFDSLTPREIFELHALQRDGHEIGSHGAMHVLAENYIKEHSYKEYLHNEIDASINSMKKEGFNPVSFAYPYGSKYWFTDWLLGDRFQAIRSVVPLNNEKDLSLMNDIYYSPGDDPVVAAVGIDGDGITREMIEKALDRAQQRKEVLILYGHAPSHHRQEATYTFDINFLRFIIREASKRNLAFLRMKDLN